MNMSTGLSSMGLNHGPKCVTYSISKTALNMLVSRSKSIRTNSFTIDLKTYKQSREEPEIIAIVFDPGWVKTGVFVLPYSSLGTMTYH